MSVIKNIWKAITATKNAVGNIIFLAFLVLIAISVFSTESLTVPESAALIINPTGRIVEQKKAIDPFAEFLSDYDGEKSETLHRDILDAIDSASNDERIKAIVLDLHRMRGASMSKLEEIAGAITEFKDSGKPVYAFADGYNQSQYFIAAHADKIYINKQSFGGFSGVFLTGLGIYPTYFKDALDKLKINFHIFKAGLYKGAVEPFLRNDMSEEAKVANSGWIGILWDHYRDTIIAQRPISEEAFKAYTDKYDELLASNNGNAAQLAVEEGFVDAILSKEDWRKEMQAIVGQSKQTYKHITLNQYLLATRPSMQANNPSVDKIAVIIASGTIYDGEQAPGNIGGESVAKLIREAGKDKRVKAVVVRIDSPGGSASASELIRSELELIQNDGIPVIISMSGYSASGGYWIASTANKIFAASTTVTGSIGVFSIFPTFEDGMAELGIHSDGVGTTALSGAFNSLQEINPVLQKALQISVTHTYQKFISLVARGRERSIEDIDSIAQGRVWAGSTAVELGLVDAIGDLDDAIASAAMLVDLDDYEVIYLEKQLSTRDKLIQQLLSSSLKVVHSATGGLASHWRLLGEVPDEISTLIDLSRAPATYLQCVVCKLN